MNTETPRTGLAAVLHPVVDDRSPTHSPNTRLVASARCSGFNWGQEKPFKDEIDDTSGETKRTVTWCMDGERTMPFIWASEDPETGELVAHKEEITFAEFRQRYTDLEWIRSNPDHPISYMRGAHRHHAALIKRIKELPQHVIVKRGAKRASIPTNATKEERDAVLKRIGG